MFPQFPFQRKENFVEFQSYSVWTVVLESAWSRLSVEASSFVYWSSWWWSGRFIHRCCSPTQSWNYFCHGEYYAALLVHFYGNEALRHHTHLRSQPPIDALAPYVHRSAFKSSQSVKSCRPTTSSAPEAEAFLIASGALLIPFAQQEPESLSLLELSRTTKTVRFEFEKPTICSPASTHSNATQMKVKSHEMRVPSRPMPGPLLLCTFWKKMQVVNYYWLRHGRSN